MDRKNMAKLFFVVPVLFVISFVPSVYGATIPSSSPSARSAQAIEQNMPPSTKGQGISIKAMDAIVSDIITFSEFSVETAITDEYKGKGIIFGGSSPFITQDGSNPTSPVLSGSPLFQGAIEGRFVDKKDGVTPIVVHSFSLDAGYFDNIGSVRIRWFDSKGEVLGQRINSQFGIEHFVITGGNIARWRIETVADEPAGYAIDNVSFVSVGPSILFREKNDDMKDGTWGLQKDQIPGYDHSAFQINNLVYESHPGYLTGTYESSDGFERAGVQSINGVQAQHSKGTFLHDAFVGEPTAVVATEDIPISEELAEAMEAAIKTRTGDTFRFIDFSFPEGISDTLSPEAQKGRDNSFTCVGLVEWAAETVGYRNGAGFIPNDLESMEATFGGKKYLIPLLSPELLLHALKTENTFANIKNWFHGMFDPVDFIITDPLGRQMGYTSATGELNDIPGSFYSGNGKIEQFLLTNPLPGEYSVRFYGLGAGVMGAMGGASSTIEFDETIPAGEERVIKYRVEIAKGGLGDVNGDGQINGLDITALQEDLNTYYEGLFSSGDLNGDGFFSQIDVDLLNQLIVHLESLNTDTVPPTTALVASGAGGPIWFRSDIAIVFAAKDDAEGTGVVKTEYSLDNDTTWQKYTMPFTLAGEGKHVVQYRSTDNAGNTEETKTAELYIDLTAPEAKIMADIALKDLFVAGKDNLGSVTVTKTASGYMIKDEAGHTTKLVLKKSFSNKMLAYAQLTGIQYDSAPLVTLPQSTFVYVWIPINPQAVLTNQTVVASKTFMINATYVKLLNKTNIVVLQNSKQVDKRTFPGLKLVMLITSKGAVGYEL